MARVRFSTEQKIVLFFIFYIYTAFLLSILFIAFIGWIAVLVIDITSIPLMQFVIHYYRLYIFKKSRDEMEGNRQLSGSIISKDGSWYSFEVKIYKYELIEITDQEMSNYEKKIKFKKALDTVKRESEDLSAYINDSEFEDEFVDIELAEKYKEIGLSTSRQIYCFEILRVCLKKDQLTQLITQLKAIATNNIGEKTDILESTMADMKISEDTLEEIAFEEVPYQQNLLRLNNTILLPYDRTNINKRIHIMSASLILVLVNIILIISAISTIISGITNGNIINPTSITTANGLFAAIIIIAIIQMVIYFFGVKGIKTILLEPHKLIIENRVTAKDEKSALCYVRERLHQLTSDAFIYKFYPLQDEKETPPEKRVYGRIWKQDSIYLITPARFDTAFAFEMDTTFHRGQPVPILSAQFIMMEIGKVLGDPMYLVIGCDYIFKNYAKVYYNYNLLQTWKDKAYLYNIADLESKISIREAEVQIEAKRAESWENFAKDQAQLFLTDFNDQRQELRKVDSSGNITQSDERADRIQEEMLRRRQMQQQQLILQQKAEQKKKVLKIIFGIIIVITIIAVIFFIVMRAQQPPTPEV